MKHFMFFSLSCVAIVGNACAATLTVGPGMTYPTPCSAFAAARNGDLIQITGNTTYNGDVCGIGVSNLTIRGVNGRPKINANGKNAMGKGIWVVTGSNVVVDNVEMYGAKVVDKNGAALRIEGTNFTLRNSFIHDNENGILTGANSSSNILIEYTEFGHNGAGDGYSHNLYVGNVASLTFRYNYSHDANVGHNLKSRAQVNTIVYNRFSSLASGQTGSTAAGQPSYEIDLPNAGTSYVIGNVIEQPSANNNPSMLAYGEEGATNIGKALYVVNNTFLNDYASGGTFVMVGSGVTIPVLIQNNIFAGVGVLTNQVNVVSKTNYRSATPGFVNRAAYDLRPSPSGLVVNAGSAPGVSSTGVSLTPVSQYRHSSSSEIRPVSGSLDIGAYEATAATATPIPTPPPVPSPTPTNWTTCATEEGTCSFSGSRAVRYGSQTAFVVKTVTGPIRCSNAVFGDPAPGVLKACSYAATTAAGSTPTNVSWTACATQFGTCVVPGTREVRYGSGGNFASMVVTGSIKCADSIFGDPKPGVAKSCSYSSVVR